MVLSVLFSSAYKTYVAFLGSDIIELSLLLYAVFCEKQIAEQSTGSKKIHACFIFLIIYK
jgi:hypothetical protein